MSSVCVCVPKRDVCEGPIPSNTKRRERQGVKESDGRTENYIKNATEAKEMKNQ